VVGERSPFKPKLHSIRFVADLLCNVLHDKLYSKPTTGRTAQVRIKSNAYEYNEATASQHAVQLVVRLVVQQIRNKSQQMELGTGAANVASLLA